jgi:hydrogenase nickel incorporation protein HypB
MCLECGCSETDQITIDGKPVERHDHSHSSHDHNHGHNHDHHEHHHEGAREISIKQEILHKNNSIAQHNREHLGALGIFTMNWISAPGSGKTALLERLIKDYGTALSIFVIEGDQQTDNDARRIQQAGAAAIQINTGAACHLDAEMIHQALHKADLKEKRLLFIENVGNMVCPTAYDLGENLKVAVISCPEGEDKPVKYPDLILASDVLLINKIDLIPYLEFDLEHCIELARNVNPQLAIFPVSAKSGQGIQAFYDWFTAKAGL